MKSYENKNECPRNPTKFCDDTILVFILNLERMRTVVKPPLSLKYLRKFIMQYNFLYLFKKKHYPKFNEIYNTMQFYIFIKKLISGGGSRDTGKELQPCEYTISPQKR